MKFHRTSLTKNYKILDETFVQTISSLYIYTYILIGFDRISNETNMEIA